MDKSVKDLQYKKFCAYGFLKNLQFFEPYLIIFFRVSGISFLQIGILFSVREIITNIMEVPSGIIADALGRKSAMIFAFISYIVSFALFFFFPGYLFFIIAMVFFGFGEAFRSGTHKAMILDYIRKKEMFSLKAEYYGHTRGWAQLGSSLSALLAALLVFLTENYRIVFLGSIIPYIAGLLLIASYPVFLNARRGTAPGAGAVLKAMKDTFDSFVLLFKRPRLGRAIFNSAIFDAAFKTTKDYIQPMLRAFGLSLPILAALNGERRVALVTGIIYSVIFLITSRASTNSSKVTGRFKQISSAVNWLYAAGIITVAASGILLALGVQWAAIALFMLFYIIMNIRRPATVSYVSDHIDDAVMASGLSAESQIKTIFVAVLAPVTGFLADAFGVGYALIIIAAFVFFLLPFVRVKPGSA
ncbi:MAG: MFS transporter [Spirochaetia bacterium]